MVVELRSADYARAAPLFAGLAAHQLAVAAVLAGAAEGTIYTDADRPRGAVLVVSGRVHVVGDALDGETADAVCTVLRALVEPQLRAVGAGRMVLRYDPPEWGAALERRLGAERRVQRHARQYYALRGLDETWRLPETPDPPSGFELRAVDRALVDDASLGNRDALLEEMTSERSSPDEFLAKSFGTVLLSESAVAGWCLSEYNLGGRCEVGIGVEPPFRRRGLATAMGAAFIHQAIGAGVTEIGWDCWADNAASAATARRLGFTLVRNYDVVVADVG